MATAYTCTWRYKQLVYICWIDPNNSLIKNKFSKRVCYMHLSHIGPISCNIFTSVSHDLDFVSSTEAFGMIKSVTKIASHCDVCSSSAMFHLGHYWDPSLSLEYKWGLLAGIPVSVWEKLPWVSEFVTQDRTFLLCCHGEKVHCNWERFPKTCQQCSNMSIG